MVERAVTHRQRRTTPRLARPSLHSGSGSVSLGLPLGEGPKSYAPGAWAPRPKGVRGKLTHYLHSRRRRPGKRSVPWSAVTRLATAGALLAALAACDLGSPQPAHRQVPADPTAVPQTTTAAAPSGRPAAQSPSATEAAAPPAPEVAPTADDELRRKRAEWQELQRMQEQARAKVEAWERSRRSTAGKPEVPHVGDAQVDESQARVARMAEDMRAWYRRYSGRSAAVTLALSQYGTASSAQPLNPSLLRDACGTLLAASTALLDDPRALRAPLENVSAALSTAYAEIKATAQSCLAYRDEDRAAHLAAALRAMAAAGTALRPYGMTP